MKRSVIYLIIVFVIAAVLRLWQLGTVPLSPNWDEAALGYNAYSILQTGRDEYGSFLPVVLQSFGDYKPALYTYLIIPFLPLFDLSVTAVRLPSAIFGIIAVIATYFLVKVLFVKDIPEKKIEIIAFLSALLLALSPWHIQFSRVGFEANVALTFVILTVLFFISGMKDGRMLPLAALFSALSIYTYQSQKIFMPLLILSLLVIYRNQLLRVQRRYIVAALIVGLIGILPIAFYTLTHRESFARAQMTSIVSRGDSILERSAKRLTVDRQENDVIGQIFNNRRTIYVKTVVNGYISHFDPNWLFITGDMPRHHAPGMGLLYIWELPLLIIGIITLLKGKITKGKIVLYSWLLLASVPAAITFDVPHAVRTLNFLPTFQIITAIGIYTVGVFLKNQNRRKLLYYAGVTAYGVGSIFIVCYFLNQYFVQQNYFYAKDWQYGYKEAVAEVQSVADQYEKIIIASDVPMDQSYIFFLFYLKYSPEQYQKEAVYHTGGIDHSFGKYVFRPLSIEKEETDGILFIGSEKDFPDHISAEETISYPDGTAAIQLVNGNSLR